MYFYWENYDFGNFSYTRTAPGQPGGGRLYQGAGPPGPHAGYALLEVSRSLSS